MKTKEEVLSYMRAEGESSVIIKKTQRVMNEFASLEGFFNASRADLMKAYNKVRPDSKAGLGDTFWVAYENVRGFFLRGPENVDIRPQPISTVPPAPVVSVMDSRMFSLEELQTIVAFMDLCGVEEINLKQITEFFSAIKIKPKKRDAAEAAEPKDGNAPKDDMTCQTKA